MTQTKKRRPQAPNQGPRRRIIERPQEVAANERYTPPRRRFSYIFRPAWHKAVGAVILFGGLSLFVACETSLGNIHAFGGHVWFLVGVAIAASSTWWFGLFDQPA